MFIDFIEFNFAPLVGMLFLLVFLISDRGMSRGIRHMFFLLSLLELIELLAYNAELQTATLAEPTMWRVFLSAVGYAIRPLLLLGIFRVTGRNRVSNRQMLLFAIPAILNVIAAFSAFFTDVVYSYNSQNEFVRGPLGYVTHVVLLFYLVCSLILCVKRSGKEHQLENMIVWAICFVIVCAVALEAVFMMRSLGRTATIISTLVYYLYFQTQNYREDIREYMEQTTRSEKEHLREMSVIGVLAKEYVTVCYVDVEKNLVTPYRMDPVIEEHYGEIFRSGVSFEKVFLAYVTHDIYEEDREFFLNLADLGALMEYLHQNGSLSHKYRVYRNGTILYCEMRAELVHMDSGVEDVVFGFSNNDMRVRREMVYQSTVQQEMDKVKEAKDSLSGIADLARKLQEEIEEKLSSL